MYGDRWWSNFEPKISHLKWARAWMVVPWWWLWMFCLKILGALKSYKLYLALKTVEFVWSIKQKPRSRSKNFKYKVLKRIFNSKSLKCIGQKNLKQTIARSYVINFIIYKNLRDFNELTKTISYQTFELPKFRNKLSKTLNNENNEFGEYIFSAMLKRLLKRL